MRWVLPSGQVLETHDRVVCDGAVCSIHNPSDHHMHEWLQHWRDDRALMERICPHGIGHPDPDHMAFYAATHSPEDTAAEAVHGCDGCCVPPEERS